LITTHRSICIEFAVVLILITYLVIFCAKYFRRGRFFARIVHAEVNLRSFKKPWWALLAQCASGDTGHQTDQITFIPVLTGMLLLKAHNMHSTLKLRWLIIFNSANKSSIGWTPQMPHAYGQGIQINNTATKQFRKTHCICKFITGFDLCPLFFQKMAH